MERPGRPVVTEKVLLSWSGGKDAALALYELQASNHYQVSALLTTVTEEYDRVTMHGVRRVLLEQQAKAVGLPLHTVLISASNTDAEYRTKMRAALQEHVDAGVSCVAFGDLFLEDVRRYREENLAEIDLQALFPLWKRDTSELAHWFVDAGFQAIVTCVDGQHLDGSFVGRHFDEQLLSDLPSAVDPCGENGEFHSFVYDGPIFSRSVEFTRGETVLRDDRFYFCDLVPSQADLR
jgi:uncharacterized protein (TIGR00290 family)